VATEHHVKRNEKEKAPEYFSQDVPLDLRGDDGTDRRTEEKPECQQARDGKIDVTGAIVAERGQKADGRQQNGQRRALRLVLREPEEVD
jgi:hypothetical protein